VRQVPFSSAAPPRHTAHPAPSPPTAYRRLYGGALAALAPAANARSFSRLANATLGGVPVLLADPRPPAGGAGNATNGTGSANATTAPPNSTAGGGGRAILYLHGGAYVIGSCPGNVYTAGPAAAAAGARVVCVEYRLAPGARRAWGRGAAPRGGRVARFGGGEPGLGGRAEARLRSGAAAAGRRAGPEGMG
jgi:acetyl esterase/lipase